MRRRPRWRQHPFVPSVLAVVLLAAACGGGSEDNSANNVNAAGDLILEGKLVIPKDLLAEARKKPGVLYSGANEEASESVVKKFKEDTGVTLDLVRTTPEILYERILSESGAGQLKADAVYMTDQYVSQLAKKGIVIPHKTPSFDAYDPRFRADDGSWYATDISTVVLAYNTALIPPNKVPTSWKALGERGRFKDGIGVPQPGLGASGWVTAMFMRKELGDDFWGKLAAQKPNIYTANATTAQDLARGEISIAPVTGVSTRNAIEDGSPVSFVIPTEGLPVYETYVGVAKSGDNTAAGKAFVDWMTSEAGMKFAASEGGRYAPLKGLDPPKLGPKPEQQLPAIEDANLWQPDPDEWSDLREPWIAEWNRAFGYVPTK